MDKRIGVVGIVVDSPSRVGEKLHNIISKHSDIVVGRMGIPHRQEDVSVIALIVEGTTDQIGGLTGQLGVFEGVTVKSALTK